MSRTPSRYDRDLIEGYVIFGYGHIEVLKEVFPLEVLAPYILELSALGRTGTYARIEVETLAILCGYPDTARVTLDAYHQELNTNHDLPGQVEIIKDNKDRITIDDIEMVKSELEILPLTIQNADDFVMLVYEMQQLSEIIQNPSVSRNLGILERNLQLLRGIDQDGLMNQIDSIRDLLEGK